MKRKLIVGTGILLLPICLMSRQRNPKPPAVMTKKSLPEIKRTRSKIKLGKRTNLTNQAAKRGKTAEPGIL